MSGGIVSFPLAALVLRYVATRSRRGSFAPKTAERVRQHLTLFARATQVAPKQVNRHHIERWLERPDLSPATVRLMFYDLRAFCRWCVVEGHMRRDPTLGIDAPEVAESLPAALRSDADEAIRNAMQTMEPRLRLIFSLERLEGLRRVEVSRAQVGDIDMRMRNMTVRGKAKGGRGEPTRRVPLSDETMNALTAYLRTEPAVLHIAALTSGHLFRSRQRPMQPLTPGHIGRLVTTEMYRLGVKTHAFDHVGGHALRHTTATEAAELGIPEKIIADFLGHSSLAVTARYTRGAARNLRQIHEAREAANDPDVIDLRDI